MAPLRNKNALYWRQLGNLDEIMPGSRAAQLPELQWLPGYCAVTEFSSRVALCSTDKSGAWHTLPTDDAVKGQRSCAKRCTRCRNCRFVSYSMSQNDCSWYAECNLRALGDNKFQTDHHSAQVKEQAAALRMGARATTFSAFPLVQRDLRAADASCSPDPLFQAALVTMQRPDRYARVLVLDAACICLNGG